MAQIDDLQFEVQRRNILFSKDTTMPDLTQLGYDGDPNNADPLNSDGEFLLHYSPSGTSFIQKDVVPFQKWNKLSDDPGGQWNRTGATTTVGTVVGWQTEFTNADLTAGMVTFTHNISAEFDVVHVSIKDNIHNFIECDDLKYTDPYSVTVDLSSFGTIPGTWAILVTGITGVPIPPIPPTNTHDINGFTLNSIELN